MVLWTARRRLALSGCRLLAFGLSACQTELPPYAEALVIVDTDLPVPRIVNRLRIDLYDTEGTWFLSRDIARPDGRDWPVSFSVYSTDEARDRLVLVRLRAYPEGRVRDYLGERFAPRPVFTAPFVASTPEELCADPPRLELGGTLTLRRGRKVLVADLRGGPDCDEGNPSTKTGSVAAYVDIPAPGDYRFGVLRTVPEGHQVTLQIRRACADPASKLACKSGISRDPSESSTVLPEISLHLDEPGRYYLVTGGSAYVRLMENAMDGPPRAPTDLVLGAALESAWGELGASEPPSPPPPLEPRLLDEGGEDVTPPSEPQPEVTVDRLALLRLRPGVRGSARVVLRGACAGTMARLSEQPPHQRPSLDEAQSCADEGDALRRVVEAELSPSMSTPTTSAVGTFGAGEPCPEASASPYVCVPGGVFLLGSKLLAGIDEMSSVPERTAAVSRFWIDRDEVTVARWNEALAAGKLDVGADVPYANNGPLAQECSTVVTTLCSWSSDATPRGRDDYALTCISWYGARAFCRSQGGDLPTEAQWEYAASAALRERETEFAWGDQLPSCDTAVYGRHPGLRCSPGDQNYGQCLSSGFGPLPVSASEHDVTPSLGVLGLGGGVAEWVLDSAALYTSDCWRAAPVRDPRCWEDDAPRRVTRGGSWFAGPTLTSASLRVLRDASGYAPNLGFRCAYAAQPTP